MLSLTARLRRDARMVWYCQKRFKKGKNAIKMSNVDRALEYYDIALPPVYRARWPSIRVALLSQQKYVALINNFADHDHIIEILHDLGATDIRHKCTQIGEGMKAKEAAKTALDETGDAASQDQGDQGEATKPVRPSLIKLDDDELAARANTQPLDRYPEEYRHRALAHGHEPGSVELSLSNRVVRPSEVGSGGTSILYDHVPASKLKGLEDWIEETDVFVDTVEGNEISLKREIQKEPITIPAVLKAFSFNKGDITRFPQPRVDHHMKVFTHYNMDGASLLPILALDLQPGDRMLDLCAAPGGKALVALQTMLPGVVVCNDLTEGRVRRLKNVMRQYIPASLSQVHDTIVVTQRNGRIPEEHGAFDKVLVDAPCLSDRHVLQDGENSIFSPKRVKERLRLPELQSQLLVSALQMVRPGGTVVYSTCTLSPLQNDGAVHMALSRIWQETTIDCCVVDLTYAMRPLNFLYRLGSNLGLRYGQIVLPSLPSNFGPMYFAKIKRLK